MSHGKTFCKQGDIGLTKKMIADNKVTVLENRIKEKIEVMSGFVDDFTKCRKLEVFFKYFDKDGSGNLNYQEFFSAMMKFNLIGVQRECEALFNRFDEDCNGLLDYKEMSQYLYGFSGKVNFDANSIDVVERVKARIIQQGGASGIHGITRMIARITKDFGHTTIDRNDLHSGLINFGITGISKVDMDRIFDAFDRDGSGRVSIIIYFIIIIYYF
jgi:Ca2+-binding EF-hand superfamily protein